MSWRERLSNQMLQATFRGVPFFIKDSERQTGRNIVIDEFTPKDENKQHIPHVDDNGLALDRFSITGYVIANKINGFDYFDNRDALINACKTQGAGELVHPYYGVKQVALIGQLKISETLDEGGIARLTMEFCEVEDIEPVKTSDFQNKVKDSVADDFKIVEKNFTDGWYTGGLFQNSSAQALKDMLKGINSVIRDIKGVANANISNTIADIADFINQVDQIIDLPFDTFTMITQAAGKIVSICQLGLETAGGAVEGLIKIATGISALVGIIGALGHDPDAQGFIPDEQKDNINLLDATFKTVLIGTAAEIGIDTNFISQTEMQMYAGLLTDEIDALLTQVGDLGQDDLFAAIEDIRSVYIDNLLERIAGLKKEKDYTLKPEIKSVMVLAYDLYEDIDREQEIIDRNKLLIRHPGFMPAGEVLKVLNE